ncbi:MAG: hypothetical protein A2Z16_16895 [Chloroflexi bacterium RBG_16_54_18]|nr:MAG: hypothetical protein A2Z16_16895 [Chloroflexi bacterium RBG_16_54_18]
MSNSVLTSFSGPYVSKLTKFLLVFGSVISVAGYLFWSQAVKRTGFPLDDAWIHQTYARNLAQSGEWFFLPGIRSAGSTSPLYTILLSLGYLLELNPFFWTYILGWICLLGIAVTGSAVFEAFEISIPKSGLWVGLFLIFEWHLVWAAVSGMETLLFAWFVLLTLSCTLKKPVNWFATGVLIGTSVWLRPDGITLMGPIVFAVYFSENGWQKRLKAILLVCLGVFILVAAYASFNSWLGGNILPNTFTAKQVEYLELQKLPIWVRLAAQIKMLLIGGGLLLLPGFVFLFYSTIRKNLWDWLGWILWIFGYLFIFAWRLPVTYQHGRYAMPTMVIYFVIGMIGMKMLGKDLRSNDFWNRIIIKGWVGATALVLVIFWFLGANAYSQDVAVIETEMVNTAKWIQQNTPADSLIAAHDIGAMGYFSNRNLIDLAGLVSPDVIPIIRDQNKLSAYLNQEEADYLVVFPGWYPQITNCLEPLHVTNGHLSVNAGGENMAVYSWTESNKKSDKCQN